MKATVKFAAYALLAAIPVFASCEPTKTPDNPGGEDTEFTIYVNYSDEWTPFAGKTGVAFTNSNDKVLDIKDDGTTVEFTGKEVGESTITAELGGETLKALVRVRAAETNGKKYITYNKPVKAYLIEYNGGAIAANMNSRAGNYGTVIEAYENKHYSDVRWSYDDAFICNVLSINAREYFSWEPWSNSRPNVWMEWDDQARIDGWQDGGWQYSEYPLDRFAFCVSTSALGGGFLWRNPGGLNDLADVAMHPNLATMPDNTDVTEYYLRSEKVCNIMCDVYKITTVTFWVDPDTGFTLKMEGRDDKGNLDESLSYEVTRLIVGTFDWDAEHLHYNPDGGDTYLTP